MTLKKFEQNNETITLIILFVPDNAKTIRLAYKSKYNRKRENQVVLLMITDGKKWHYLALKSKHVHDGKNGIIIPQKVFQNYLDKLHEIIMEIFIVLVA